MRIAGWALVIALFTGSTGAMAEPYRSYPSGWVVDAAVAEVPAYFGQEIAWLDQARQRLYTGQQGGSCYAMDLPGTLNIVTGWDGAEPRGRYQADPPIALPLDGGLPLRVSMRQTDGLLGLLIEEVSCGENARVLFERIAGEDRGLPAGAELSAGWTGPLVMTDSRTLALPTSAGLYLWSPSTPEALPALALDFEGLEALARQQDPDAEGLWSHAGGVWQIRAAAGMPGGRLWVLFRFHVSNEENHHWLVEIAADGAATLVLGPASLDRPEIAAAERLVYSAVQEAVFTGPALSAVIGAMPGFAPRALALPPMENEQPVAFPASDGSLLTTEYSNYESKTTFYPVSLDTALLDLDRDGLRMSTEESLGLSDFDPDADRDGVGDGAERGHFGTNPLDAADRPPVTGWDRTEFAPSTLLSDWTWLDTSGHHPWEWGVYNGLFCRFRSALNVHQGEETMECRDTNGAPLPPGIELTGTPYPAPERWTLFHAEPVTSSPWMKIFDNQSGTLESHWLLERYDDLTDYYFPLNPDLVFEVQNDTQRARLIRHTPEGSFDVVDSARVACPILGSPVEEAERCVDPASVLEIDAVEVRGWDSRTGRLFVSVTYGKDGSIYSVDAEGIRFVTTFDAYEPWDYVSYLYPIPGSTHFVASLARGVEHTNAILDEALQPVARTQAEPFGYWYRDGFSFETWWIHRAYDVSEADSGFGCAAAGGAVICGADSMSYFRDRVYNTMFQNVAELVPVAPALEPGEAVFFADRLNLGDGVAPGGGAVNSNPGKADSFVDDWALWRVTKLGGVQRWIDADEFTALVEQASGMPTLELGEVQQMSVADDGLSICMTEGSQGRLWVLHLDPTTHVPERIGLEQESGVDACGWDVSGGLVSASSSGLTVGGATVSAAAAVPVHDLVRLGGDWLVIGRGGESWCARADGTAVARPKLKGATAHDGKVYFVDADDRPRVALVEGFCVGEEKRVEGLTPEAIDLPEPPPAAGALDPNATNALGLWTATYNALLRASPYVVSAANSWITVRPDGLVLVAPRDLGMRDYFDLMGIDDMLLRIRPSYWPVEWEERIEAHDPLRREEARIFPMTVAAQGVGALAIVPGGEPFDLGHEYRGETPPKPWKPAPGTEPEPPPPTPGPDPVEPDEPGCGCLSAGGAAPASLMMLIPLLALRRRRGRLG